MPPKRKAAANNATKAEEVKKQKQEIPEEEKKKPSKKTKASKSEEKASKSEESAPKASKSVGKTPKASNDEKAPKASKSAGKASKASKNAEKVPKATENAEKATKAKKAPKTTEKAEPKPLLNATETAWDKIDFGCTNKNSKGQKYNLKLTSWNVDGLRAWLKKDGLSIFQHDNPDILCLQETKCSDGKLPEEVKGIEGYNDYWCSSEKEGYAGVAVYTKNEPLSVKKGIDEKQHDAEGRCLTVEFPKFFLVNVYVPNAGRGLVTLDKRLEWNEAFKAYIKKLDNKKPVIICGDMNVAHSEIDLSNPKTNKKNAGFTQEERDGMTEFLADGYVDSFRELYPEEENVYTFWSYMNKARPRNIGWRLDYFILSKKIMENVCDNVMRKEVYGSDHCPITLFINI